ncbi:hypothetical protein D9758_007866 [Tetrapyrgos nigripes]|uniref:VHS domain-containing protein n=1 Tax=Tetrapyrgos nigripes TaxID=182062 RepID=A0A8H5D477_9AGAR|nr:hypothetical protein D9758_007866 [Tetrapyrgos nigripes]
MKKFFSAKPKQQEKDPIPTTTPTQQHTPIHQQHAAYRDEDDYHLVETPPRSPSPGPKSQQQSKKPAPVLGILKALDPDSPIEQTDHSRRDVKWFAGWNRDRDREKDKQWQMVDKDSTALTRMIGFLTATSSEDWALVLEVCETASAGETSAKEAVRALRREFKYGEPQAQLSAARLWAIMLRNSSDTFIAQSTSRKFLDTLEDLIRNPATNPVVKERVLDVIAAAAYASASKKDTTGFRGLWRRVKSLDKPDEGIPFDTDDAMFNPPIAGHRGSYYEGQFSLGSAGQFPPGSIVPGTTPNLSTGTLPITQIDTLPPKETQKDNKEKDREKSERKHRHRDHSERERSHKDRENRERERDKDGHKDKSHRKKEKKSTKDKIIPLEEDIRRLFQECKIGMGNAGLLSQAVGHTKPEELDLEGDGKDVISEFQIKCMSSQELIAAQIPWASASADKSRREREREKILLYAQDTEHVRQRTVSQSSVNVIHALSPNLGRTGSTASIPLSTTAQGQDDFDDEQTTEERLLAALLEANEELLEY